jgi:polyribonucleotide nucleotidyltransferase
MGTNTHSPDTDVPWTGAHGTRSVLQKISRFASLESMVAGMVKLATFGAFISLVPGRDGLLHISELKKMAGGKRVENVEDVLEVGQRIQVEISKIDDRGKLSLSPVDVEEA